MLLSASSWSGNASESLHSGSTHADCKPRDEPIQHECVLSSERARSRPATAQCILVARSSCDSGRTIFNLPARSDLEIFVTAAAGGENVRHDVKIPLPNAEGAASGTSDVRRQPPHSAGDPIPSNCAVIQIHVVELKQLFNSIDPSPFHQRDLDPSAEEFLVGWAQEEPADAQLALVVYLDRPAGLQEEPAILRDAVREFFGQRAAAARRRLHHLFKRGRTSLVIGVTFLAASLLLGNLVARVLGERSVGEIVRESLLIGGWVAMWRPMELFLYDWWPIRAEARLGDRLSAMPVRITYQADGNSEAWRTDWPIASPPTKPRMSPERPSGDAAHPGADERGGE